MISEYKKYRTRNGEKVVIYTDRHPNDYPIVGRVGTDVMLWDINGLYRFDKTESQFDLIEVNPYQEILAEAKIRYKVGDRLLCVKYPENSSQEYAGAHVNQEDIFNGDGELWFADSKDFGICIYNNGKWAEIVQPEETTFNGLEDQVKENINNLTFEQLTEVAKMCMDRMLELSKG
jgi:hypothetical protein